MSHYRSGHFEVETLLPLLEIEPRFLSYPAPNFEVRHPRCVGSVTKNFSCITLTVEHNYISCSSTLGIQLHVSALYVGHLQVVLT